MIGLELTDGLGRVWPLTGYLASPGLLKGVKGLGRPSLAPVKVQAPAGGRGSRWAGWRATEREVVLPLTFRGATLSASVRDFAQGVVPDQPGQVGLSKCVLTALLPDSTRWTLDMRLTDDGGLLLSSDPDMLGWLQVVTSWDADVFWSGQEWSGSWQAATSTGNWLLASGGVALISPAHALSTASTVNAGDVRAWPVWTITGPCTTATVGVGGHYVTLAATLSAGQTVTIDTDPEVGQSAVRDDGTDVTDLLTDVDWAPIDPGTSALEISMGGTGTVAMSYQPRRLAIL